MIIDRTGGDMFEDEVDVRVNAVNTRGAMGAGLAAQFRSRERAYYTDHRAKCARGEIRAGRIDVFERGETCIVSVPTKRHWRDPSGLEDVVAGIEALGRWAIAHAPLRIAIPALGCGLGGLQWSVVRPHIERVFGEAPGVEVWLYGPGSRGGGARRRSRR